MGLIKSLTNAIGGTMADQWVDFITCDSMPETILMRPGTRPAQSRSGNNRFSENIITNGSKINVADGQCMLIIDNGKIADYCAEPGQYVYDNQTQPSLLGGGFKDLGLIFQQIGKRFAAGGAPTAEQKVYYVNTKEIIGNKIGMGRIPFRDGEFNFTVMIQGYGMYSFKIQNPLLFYTAIAGNCTGEYKRDDLALMMKSEMVAALQPALGRIAALRICYDQLISYPKQIGEELNKEMSTEWEQRRGIVIVSVALESITVDEASAKMISKFQESRVFSDMQMAGGRLVAGQANAMETAAANENGAMGGFMGMGMGQMMGGMSGGQMLMQGQQMQQQQTAAAPVAQAQAQSAVQTPAAPVQAPSNPNGWTCSCGVRVPSGNFCPECGGKKPVPVEASGWTCSCGAISQGKFCMQCGSKKPAGVPQYKCDKCGWEPADPKTAPKFCPECGDPFGDEDIKV